MPRPPLHLALAALAAAAAVLGTPAHRAAAVDLDGDEIGLLGNAGRPLDSDKPAIAAFFTRESYRPGDHARLVVDGETRGISVQVFRAGAGAITTLARDEMRGVAVTARSRYTPRLAIGDWPSGLYYARLAAGVRVGYAPFVLAPRALGEHRVAVVLPTQTWQAYNFSDDDGDGHPDTWYAGWSSSTARLHRAFLNRGVPPHYGHYDAPFLAWLAATHRVADFLSDEDLRTLGNGRALAEAYDLVVFSGHHEYVTSHEYHVVTQYRNLGGNLAFLSANNFFWKITIAHGVMTRIAEWRDLGRPEAALIGVQYRGNDRGTHRGPWELTAAATTTTPWLLTQVDGAATGEVGLGGIEIDATAPSSPPSTRVLAEIPNLFGPGFTAQMTYYQTQAGAKVFAAGAFSLADGVQDPPIAQLVANIWDNLSSP
jgi:N,N-dimethylformamidase beta subunit-like, C-terminal